jgi:acetamidase/formamidase
MAQQHVGNLSKYMKGFIKKDREYVINMVVEELSLPEETRTKLMTLISTDEAETPSTSKSKRSSSRGILAASPKLSEESKYVMMEVLTNNDITYLVDGENNLYTYSLDKPEKVGILLADGNVKINQC